MINLGIMTIDPETVILLFAKGLVLFIGVIYILYVILQLRQIGIMNSTLKTRAGVPIAIIGLIHLVLVVAVLLFVELYLFTQ